MRYLTVFHTHIWNESVSSIAHQARRSASSGEFIVAIDETHGPVEVGEFRTLSHTNDFSSFALPSLPRNGVLWWNADYVLYAARKALPDFDYYVMLEYDVFINCDVDRMLAQCAEIGVDLVAQDLKRLSPENPWFSSISEFSPEPWWALIPFIIVSDRAIDAMLRIRQAIAARLAAGEASEWPYCETFIPTAILQQKNMSFAPLSNFVDTQLLRFRPYISILEPNLTRPQSISHPVLGGVDYIGAITASLPPDKIVLADGRLCAELQRGNPTELERELGARVQRDPQTHEFAVILLPSKKESLRGNDTLIDLAYGKPALQSSRSKWSKGISAADDAAFAVCGILPNDFAFHTELEINPWWQVDLGAEVLIEEIEIVNRARAPDRFRSFLINTSLDGESWETQFSKSDSSVISNTPASPFSACFHEPVWARYVRIVQTGQDVMHLRRVRVFGRPLTSQLPPYSVPPSSSDHLAALLSDPAGMQKLTQAVLSIVHSKAFGRGYESHNLDDLTFLAAGVDSSQYMMAHMTKAERLLDRLKLLTSSSKLVAIEGLILEFGVYSGQSVNLWLHYFLTNGSMVSTPSRDYPRLGVPVSSAVLSTDPTCLLWPAMLTSL
jgi:hypothetical protein